MLIEAIRETSQPLAPQSTGAEAKPNRLGGVKAVLFDIYGTLFISGSGDVGTAMAFDSAEALTQALVVTGFAGEVEQAGLIGKELLKKEILAWHEAGHKAGTDYPEVEISKVWKKIVDGFLNAGLLKKKAVEIEQIRHLAVAYECRVNPVFPMPHALETINAVKEKGCVPGIVSNAQFYTPLLFPAFFGKTLEELGFDPACCIWSYKELKAKPSKALFPKVGKHLFETYSIKPEETVYVGNDMLNDILCARQAGCQTVLFAGDKRSLRLREDDPRCTDIEPDAIITSLDQLPELLD
ncbi:MAG: HAD family hydrolase [Kiritimatiellales bacterium]|nr:HAD family hydrolase [Kiritimatiellales bacterium]